MYYFEKKKKKRNFAEVSDSQSAG